MRIIILWLSFTILLFAYDKTINVSITPIKNSQTHYFVKIASYLNESGARKKALSLEFPTNIIFLKRYYSLLSQSFSSKKEAKQFLQRIKHKFSDAYIIKLYQPLSKPIKPKTLQKISTPEKQKNIYKQALTYYNGKAYEDALVLFDRILIETPTNANAKYYYAKTLYKLGFLQESAKSFSELKKINLNTKVEKSINTYLKDIEHKTKRNFFTATLSYGIGHDDNINLNTDKSFTQYGPYLLQNDTNKTKSSYGILSLNISHHYKAKSFDLISNLYTYNELAHSAKGNDLNYIDMSSAIMKNKNNFTWMLPIGYNRIYLDDKLISYNFYTHPSIRYTITKKLNTTFFANYTDNHTKYAPDRDYHILGGGIGIRYKSKKSTSLFNINLQRYTKKESTRYDINKNQIDYMLWEEYQIFNTLYLGTNVAYSTHDYRDLDPVMGYKRKDKRTLYALWIRKSVDKKTAIKAEFQHTINSSDINLYSYHKNNYTINYQHIF